MTPATIVAAYAMLVLGIILLVRFGGWLLLKSLWSDIRRNPSLHGSDEYANGNSIGGGDGFHPHAHTQNGGQDRAGQ